MVSLGPLAVWLLEKGIRENQNQALQRQDKEMVRGKLSFARRVKEPGRRNGCSHRLSTNRDVEY